MVFERVYRVQVAAGEGALPYVIIRFVLKGQAPPEKDVFIAHVEDNVDYHVRVKTYAREFLRKCVLRESTASAWGLALRRGGLSAFTLR